MLSKKKKKYQSGGNIDLTILGAIESNLDANRVSNTGDTGLLQINKSSLIDFNKAHNTKFTEEDLFNPEINVRVGDWYINKQIPKLLKSNGLEDNIQNRLSAYRQGARGLANNGPDAIAEKRISQYLSAEYLPHSNKISINRNNKREEFGIPSALGINPFMHGPNIIKGFQRGGLINTTGYTPGTDTFNNPINIIPSNNITMKNTPFNVLGIADTGERRVMKPGSNHRFKGAKSVTEIPLLQFGGIFDTLNSLTNLTNYFTNQSGLINSGTNRQANSVLQDGLNVGNSFFGATNDRFQANEDQLFADYPGLDLNQGNLGLDPSSPQDFISSVQDIQSRIQSNADQRAAAFAATPAVGAFGTLFSLNQTNHSNALNRQLDPLYSTNIRNSTVGPTIVKHGGKMPKYQLGGEVQPIPVQTEKGETVLLPNGKLVDVNAKKKHKNMDRDFATDMLPPDSFVFSNDKKMKLSKDKAEDIELGYDRLYYDENEIGNTPMMKKLSDFFPKGKKDLTFSELSKEIRKKYPVTKREGDAFAEVTKEANIANRYAFLDLVKNLNIEKMPKSEKEKQNIPTFQFGGGVMSSNFNQLDNNAITGSDYIDLVDKRDKALRNDRLFPTNLFSQNAFKGLRPNNSFMPKGQLGLLLGAGALANQFLGTRGANKDYRERLAEIEALNSRLEGRINTASGLQALGTLGQDTRYTTLQTDPLHSELESGFLGAEQAITSGRDVTNNQINSGNRALLRGLSDAGLNAGEISSNFAVARAGSNDAINRNNSNAAQQLANLRLQRSQGRSNLINTDIREAQNATHFTRNANNQIVRNLADIGSQNQNSLNSLDQYNDNLRLQALQDRNTRKNNVTNNSLQLLGGATSFLGARSQFNQLTNQPLLQNRAQQFITPVQPLTLPLNQLNYNRPLITIQ